MEERISSWNETFSSIKDSYSQVQDLLLRFKKPHKIQPSCKPFRSVKACTSAQPHIQTSKKQIEVKLNKLDSSIDDLTNQSTIILLKKKKKLKKQFKVTSKAIESHRVTPKRGRNDFIIKQKRGTG